MFSRERLVLWAAIVVLFAVQVREWTAGTARTAPHPSGGLDSSALETRVSALEKGLGDLESRPLAVQRLADLTGDDVEQNSDLGRRVAALERAMDVLAKQGTGSVARGSSPHSTPIRRTWPSRSSTAAPTRAPPTRTASTP